MTRMITAELLVLRKRAATWILLGLWTLLSVFFAYVIPYALDPEDSVGGLNELLPQSLAATLIAGFPFFGGVFALMLGVFAIGSEYGWDTLKTLFTQGPGRLRVLAAKWAALGALLGVLTRGTSLAIGVGILYALVIEGLLSAFTDSVGVLEPLSNVFLRSNGYSLATALGALPAAISSNGPGSFGGPFVAAGQAVAVLVAFVAGFAALAALVLRRRDVT
jgi:ABC-type transport system involved in multi-copper enzyme maturation permease subunit